jgi:hypothetical protein
MDNHLNELKRRYSASDAVLQRDIPRKIEIRLCIPHGCAVVFPFSGDRRSQVIDSGWRDKIYIVVGNIRITVL